MTADNPFADCPVIDVYSRAEAIDDGVLVDVTAAAVDAGHPRAVPVVITRALFDLVDLDGPEAWRQRRRDRGESTSGRMHDLLWMALLALRRGLADPTERREAETGGTLYAAFGVIMPGPGRGRLRQLLVAFNRLEGLTVMLPEDR